MSPEAPARAAPAWSGLALALAVLGGCGPAAGPVGFGSTPLVTVSSDSGALTLQVFTDPQPPVRGSLGIRYRLTDAEGAPVDGLTVTVTPWMNAMGHGTSVTPTVSPRGDGVYELEAVYLFMAGQWTLRTTLSGSTLDHAGPELTVQ